MYRQAISLNAAQQKLASLPLQIKTDRKKVIDCLDEVLAENIYASFPLPAFRRAGYDGFGISSQGDTDFPKTFEVVGQLGAGAVFSKELQNGQALRVMTGAMLPDSVAKVIMLEKTRSLSKNKVEILATEAKSNITPVGDEFAQGTCLLTQGTRLNAGALSLLSAFGYQECLIKKKTKSSNFGNWFGITVAWGFY